jgi:hypothetical protein
MLEVAIQADLPELILNLKGCILMPHQEWNDAVFSVLNCVVP